MRGSTRGYSLTISAATPAPPARATPPTIGIRVHLRNALVAMYERSMLVRPLENRALAILHLRVTGAPQPVRHRARAVSDHAVVEDRRIFGQFTRRCFGIRREGALPGPPRAGEPPPPKRAVAMNGIHLKNARGQLPCRLIFRTTARSKIYVAASQPQRRQYHRSKAECFETVRTGRSAEEAWPMERDKQGHWLAEDEA